MTSQIVALLISERDRLNHAIEVLQGPTKRIGRPPKNTTPEEGRLHSDLTATAAPKKKRRFSKAQREAAAERMRQRWAARKKAEAKGMKKTAGKSRRIAKAA
jgi:DNA replication initiation complex subunit (GINS family)